MSNVRRKILMIFYKLSDILVMIGSFMAATVIVSHRVYTIPLNQFLHMRVKVINFVLFVFVILVWHFMFSMFGLYSSRRLSTMEHEFRDVAKATFWGTVSIYFLSLIFRIEMMHPIFLASFWAVSTGATILVRMMMRQTLKWMRRRGRNLRYLLIVGTNPRAVEFARKIESEPELGYVVSGFVDEEWRGLGEFKRNGHALIADFDGFMEYIRNNVVDEVFISLPIKSYYQETARIITACESQGILVKHLSNVYDSKHSNFKLEYFEDEPFVARYTGSINGWQVPIKRVLDIIMSAILLILFSPLFLLISVIIKIDSPGPAFFIQERVGLNKRRFRLYKFRTMVKDAEQKQTELEDLNEVMGAAFKIKNDPRITAVGKFLRKTSIDEIPQLINVLKGDMSLVGPRPLPVRDYNGFSKDWHRRRFSVRPGITCLWQINGRSTVAFEKWMKLDMEYIDQWSLMLDFRIMIKTIPAVIRGSGAE